MILGGSQLEGCVCLNYVKTLLLNVCSTANRRGSIIHISCLLPLISQNAATCALFNVVTRKFLNTVINMLRCLTCAAEVNLITC